MPQPPDGWPPPHLAALAGVVAEHDVQRWQGGGRQPAVPPRAVRRHVLRVEVHVHHAAVHLGREGGGAGRGGVVDKVNRSPKDDATPLCWGRDCATWTWSILSLAG